MIILQGARLLDGTGAEPMEKSLVVIQDKTFRHVGFETDIAPDGEVHRFDLSGMTLLPGFIDCHVHITGNPDPDVPPIMGPYQNGKFILHGAANALKTLEAGFTTIQDMMAPNEVIFPLRDSIASGETLGSRIFASGKAITITGGHGTQFSMDGTIEADGAQEVFKAVRSQIKAGANVIKIMVTRPAFSPPYHGREAYQVEELIPGIQEAHRAGLRVCAHAHSIVSGVKNAVLAGVDSVEHCAPVDDEVIDLMAERGTFMVPTLSVEAGLEECLKVGESPYPPAAMKRARELAEEGKEAIAKALARGVNIALGSDAAMPRVWHGGNAREMEMLVKHGLTPMQAIVAGTRNAARNIGKERELGTIQVGKIADLVVFDGNPLEDIRLLQNLERIKLVFKEGKIVVDRRLSLLLAELKDGFHGDGSAQRKDN